MEGGIGDGSWCGWKEGTMTMPNSQPANQPTSLLEWKEEGRDVRWGGGSFSGGFVPLLSVRPTNGFETSQPNHSGGWAVPAWRR